MPRRPIFRSLLLLLAAALPLAFGMRCPVAPHQECNPVKEQWCDRGVNPATGCHLGNTCAKIKKPHDCDGFCPCPDNQLECPDASSYYNQRPGACQGPPHCKDMTTMGANGQVCQNTCDPFCDPDKEQVINSDLVSDDKSISFRCSVCGKTVPNNTSQVTIHTPIGYFGKCDITNT